MGTPTSSILEETYLQHMEHTQIYPILIKHEIIAYFRYVDDILIIYDQNKTNIDHTLEEFNKTTTNHKVYNRKRTTRIYQLFRSPNKSERKKVLIFNRSKTYTN
jgi:hypothetical protein